MPVDFRMLQTIQRAIPVFFRHLDGYVELAEEDWAATKLLARDRLKSWLVLLVSSLFAIAAVFIFVIALSWDTDYRLLAIGGLVLLSAGVAIAAALRLQRRRNERAFGAVRREWARDRAMVQRLLSESRPN